VLLFIRDKKDILDLMDKTLNQLKNA
jgi:hypothetical protein